MVAINEAYAPSETGTPTQNRVGRFFERTQSRACQSQPASRTATKEKAVVVTITVSGRPFWPSRDPLGEQGGLNLYGFVENNPNGYIDFLGRDPINTQTTANPVLDPNPGNGSDWRNPNTGQYSKPGTVPGVKLPDPKPKPKGSKHAGPDAIATAVVNTLLSLLDDRLFRDAQAQCQKQVPYNHKSAASGCKCCVITIYYVQNNYSGFVLPAGSVGTVFKGSCSAAQSAWRSTGPTYKPSFTSNSNLQSDFSTFLPW